MYVETQSLREKQLCGRNTTGEEQPNSANKVLNTVSCQANLRARLNTAKRHKQGLYQGYISSRQGFPDVRSKLFWRSTKKQAVLRTVDAVVVQRNLLQQMKDTPCLLPFTVRRRPAVLDTFLCGGFYSLFYIFVLYLMSFVFYVQSPCRLFSLWKNKVDMINKWALNRGLISLCM